MARDTANILTATATSNSSSQFPLYVTHAYNIAGQNYPVARISTHGESVDEAYDVFSHVSRRDDSGGLLSRNQSSTKFDVNNQPVAYTDGTAQLAALAGATSPSHVLAVNLAKCGPSEVYWGKGMNLSSSNLASYLNVNYSTLNAQTITIFSIFQMKIHIDALGNFTTEF